MGIVPVGNRKMMAQAIKKIIVPELRKQGFKGSYPHFRREQDTHQELLMFYITKYSENFYIETGVIPLTGYLNSEGDLIPPNKVTVFSLKGNERFTIGSDIVANHDGMYFMMKGLSSEEEHEQLAEEAFTYLKTSEPDWIAHCSEWNKKLYESFDEDDA